MADIIDTLHPEGALSDNLYPNIKKDNIPNGSVDRNKLSMDVNGLLDNIGELKPSGVDTSSHILAFTTNKGIYIGSDTGNWYYWNGTQYVSGGVYQASVYNDDIMKVALPLFDIDDSDITNDYYIAYNNGAIAPLSGNKYITINVNGISAIYYNATRSNPDLRGLAFYTKNKTFISGAQMLTTRQKISVPSGAYYCRATIVNLSDISIVSSILDILPRLEYNFKLYNTHTSEIINGYYIYYGNGNVIEHGGSKYLRCYCYGVKTIRYTLYQATSDAGGLAFYDRNGTYISGFQATNVDSDISVPTGAYYLQATVSKIDDVILDFSINDLIEYISNNTLEIDSKISSYNIDETNVTSGYYISYDGNRTASSGSLSYVTLVVKNIKTLTYNYTIKTPDYRGLAFYDEGGVFISGYQTISTPQLITVPERAYYCKATIKNNNQVLLNIDANYINKKLYELKKDTYNILQAYNNIYCAGDSLTYSQVYTSGSSSRQAYIPYPKSVEKLTGTVVNYNATAGYDAIDWWTNNENNIIHRDNQLAIIYLGTNHGLTDTLDTDCVGDDYTQWANTNTGCYAKIVAKCLSVGMKVALLKIWTTSGSMGAATTNDVIDQIATRFECAVIEPINLTDVKYHYFPDRTGTNNVHYNDLGYGAFASALINKISNLDDNQMKFIIPN